MKLRLMRQMLAAAETDLQPARLSHLRQRIGQLHLQMRQQFIHQCRMMTAQGFPLAPPVELMFAVVFGHVTAAITSPRL